MNSFIDESSNDDKLNELLRLLNVLDSENTKDIFLDIKDRLDSIYQNNKSNTLQIPDDQESCGSIELGDLKLELKKTKNAVKELKRRIKEANENYLRDVPGINPLPHVSC